MASTSITRVPCTSAGCDYVLTRPIESLCPCCSFKDKSKLKPQFDLLPVEQFLAALPTPVDGSAKAGKDKAAPKKEQKKKGGAQAAAGGAATSAAGAGEAAKGEEKKKAKSGGGGGGGGAADADASAFDKVLVKVGLLAEVAVHPESDKLLVCQVELGEDRPRTICAGMQQFYKPEELQGRHVCVMCNLKPTKPGGIPSEGMILAGTSADGAVVRVLRPADGSAPGDRVFEEGRAPSAQQPKSLKSNHMKAVKAGLAVGGGFAQHAGRTLRTEAGPVAVPDLPDGAPVS